MVMTEVILTPRCASWKTHTILVVKGQKSTKNCKKETNFTKLSKVIFTNEDWQGVFLLYYFTLKALFVLEIIKF